MDLGFELTFKANELKHLDLPVEIRKPNMVLVQRVLASEKVELDPGTYYVGIKMPAGQESWAEVKVSPGRGNQTIRLGPEPSEALASESQELQRYFAPTYVTPQIEELTYLALIVAAAAGALIGAAAAYVVKGNSGLAIALSAAVGGGLAAFLLSKVLRPGYAVYKRRVHEAHLRKFDGNVLTGDLKENYWAPRKETVKTTDELIEISLEGENRGQIIQLLQTDEPAVNVVLPAWQERGCRVVLKKQPDARYSLEVHLKNTEAELLLRYWEQGRWQLAANVAGSDAISAERLLYDKLKHPISAAVGGYALLRLGALDRLHDWSANLMEFGWLPDGAAVRGEHLARIGEHRKALQAFCALRERGLPYFSDGLNYAVDRLRRYQSLGEKHFDAKDLKDCADTLARLEPFSYFTDSANHS